MEAEQISNPFLDKLQLVQQRVDEFIQSIEKEQEWNEAHCEALQSMNELQQRIHSVASFSRAVHLLASLAMSMHGLAQGGDGRKQSVKEARHFLPDVMKVLEHLNVELIGVNSEEFNPQTHCVVETEPANEEHPEGSIARYARFGVLLGGEVLFPAQVVVYSNQDEKEKQDEHDKNDTTSDA